MIARVEGKGAAAAFAHEVGGHRWQRVPPNDKHGRVHTSTVTVAVLREPTVAEFEVADRDLAWSTCRGSGAGGQHRNKTESAVVLRHVPTGMTVRCESERSQLQNKGTALGLLRARLLAQREANEAAGMNASRRAMVGTGMRGDKRRTQVQNGIVVDHETGRRAEVRDYLRNGIDVLK